MSLAGFRIDCSCRGPWRDLFNKRNSLFGRADWPTGPTARHSRQPGRQAGQPHRQRGRSLSTAHAVEERFWRREPTPPTDMPRELWLYIYKVRAPHIRGERRSPRGFSGERRRHGIYSVITPSHPSRLLTSSRALALEPLDIRPRWCHGRKKSLNL